MGEGARPRCHYGIHVSLFLFTFERRCPPFKLQTCPKGKDDLIIRLLLHGINIKWVVFLKFLQPIEAPVLGVSPPSVKNLSTSLLTVSS